jgi:hypothetical protein
MHTSSCRHLSDFMKTEMNVIQKHLDEHSYLRHIENKNDALASFINDYGWLMRELYCTKICADCRSCDVAAELDRSGDLLRNRQAAGEQFCAPAA